MNRIMDIRTKQKLSGVSAAKQIGISPQFYYEIEKGVRTLTASTAWKLADLFGTTVDYLIGRTE